MNFTVLQGLVNQKNDVSGRLLIWGGIALKCIFIYIYTDHSIVTFLTLAGLVWDSCLAHLCLSLQASPASPSHPLFQASFLLFPVKHLSTFIITRKHRYKIIVCMLGRTAYTQHMFSILFIHAWPPATNSLLGEEWVGQWLFQGRWVWHSRQHL